MMRPVSLFGVVSCFRRSCGYSGVSLLNCGRLMRFLDAHAVDGIDGLQRHELLTLVAAFAFTRGANGAMHGVALAQAVLLDLAHGNVHVVRTRQIAGGTHECVGVEHVDNAGDRHEIVLLFIAIMVRSLRSLRAASRSSLRSHCPARSLRSLRSLRSPCRDARHARRNRGRGHADGGHGDRGRPRFSRSPRSSRPRYDSPSLRDSCLPPGRDARISSRSRAVSSLGAS